MSLRRRFDFFDDPFYTEASILATRHLALPSFLEDPEDATFALDLLRHPLDFFDPFADLVQIERIKPSSSCYRRIRSRIGAESYLETLIDRVSALELSHHRLLSERKLGERKCLWKTEIEEKRGDRKYKWTSEIKEAEKKKKNKKHHHLHQHHKEGKSSHHKEGKSSHHKEGKSSHHKEGKSSYKWTVEIKEKGEEGPIKRTYTWKSSSGDGSKLVKDKKEKKEKEKKKGHCTKRLVKIEEHDDHADLVLRQAFARRAGAIKKAKGKNKELSPHDAAATIQMNFRAHLIRRSRALRALRELAVAKAKLKEIRSLFNNFAYNRRIAIDAEERQRFTEKIIVVLLTVDAIEGIDLLVRAAKKSMISELEAMLDVVDPQPPGKSLHRVRRRTFDVPDGLINKEIAEGVGQIMTMLEEEEGTSTSSHSDAA